MSEIMSDNKLFIYFIALWVIALGIIPIISAIIFAFTPNGSPLAEHFLFTALSILFSKATLRIFIICCLLDIIISDYPVIADLFKNLLTNKI